MKRITITLDTSTIGEPELEKLDQWSDKNLIDICVTGTVKTELMGRFTEARDIERLHPQSRKLWEKAKEYPVCCGDASVFDSLVGYAEVANEDFEQIRKKIKDICFPTTAELTENQRRDINHLATHIKYRRDIFVTGDKKAFIKDGKREKLKLEFCTEIMTPEECVDFLSLEKSLPL